MNQNIEVIKPYLWSVRFSLIPFISEINYNDDLTEKNYFFLGNNGAIVLNQDSKIYPHLKGTFLKLINKSSLMLKSKLKKLSGKKKLEPMELLTSAAIKIIIESRKLR